MSGFEVSVYVFHLSLDNVGIFRLWVILRKLVNATIQTKEIS